MSLVSRFWTKWKSIAHKIGNFQARLILVLFYFLILAPFALLVKRSDPLGIKKNSPHGWLDRAPETRPPLEKAIRQW
jgi:hypothetical protein